MWWKGQEEAKERPTTSTMKKITKQISALTAAIASLMGIAADNQDDNGSGADTATGGNRNNSALTRQGQEMAGADSYKLSRFLTESSCPSG